MNGKQAKRLRKYVDGYKYIFGDIVVMYKDATKSQFFLGQKKMIVKCHRKYCKDLKRQIYGFGMHLNDNLIPVYRG